MAGDPPGGLYYSGDVTGEVRDPQLTYSNLHGQRDWSQSSLRAAYNRPLEPAEQPWA